MLILMAIVFVAVPEILIAVLAASMIMVGIVALRIGHMIRKSEMENRYFDSGFVVNDFSGLWSTRAPISMRWYRMF
jgi:hypothetical protein